MSEGQSYTAHCSDALFRKRSVVQYQAGDTMHNSGEARRVFVPFSGFDGQSLAGSGALVFEGEVLDRQH